MPATARFIQTWSPQRFEEFVGNSGIIQTLKDFVDRGPANLLITGPSRSGKTRSLKLGIIALCCPNRIDRWNPCGRCATCRDVGEVRSDHSGFFALQSRYSYIYIDCERVSKEGLLAAR